MEKLAKTKRLTSDDMRNMARSGNNEWVINDVVDVLNNDKVKEEIPEEEKNEYLCPVHPFRLCVIGRSGSGKSCLVLNMLFKYLRYDNFVLISKTARLQEQFEVICDLAELFPSKFKIFENVLSFQLKDVAKTKKTIIVVDDYQEESEKEQLYINKLFIKSRHYNCSTIYLAQSYFKISQRSRASANYFIFFRINSTKEINRIHKEIAGEMTQEEFHDLFITATDADGECWSYLMVDTNAKTIHEKFRKNMKCVYMQ